MAATQVIKLHSLTGHRDCVYTLEGSSERSIFFSASGDGMVVKWNLEDPEKGELIAKLPNSVYALHYHLGSDFLIAAHNYEGIHLLDWKNKKEAASLKLTMSAIYDLKSVDEKLLVATGDGSVTLIDVGNLSVLKKAQHSDKSARTISVDPSSGDIAVGFSDHFIRVFDANLDLKSEWKAHANSVFTLRYIPGSNILMSGGRDARLRIWDGAKNYGQVAEIVAHLYAINHIDFSPDGKHFVTCSMDKSIKVWDLEELRLLKVVDKARHAGHGTSVNKLLWTSYRSLLLSASDDRTISSWDINFVFPGS